MVVLLPLARADTHATADGIGVVYELAAEKGVSVPKIALAWVLQDPELDVYALVGARTPAEAQDNQSVFDVVLTPQERAWLDLQRDDR